MSGIDLLITGLCSFVPKYPLEKWNEHEDNQMTVLLAESAKPLPRHSALSHLVHELHVPVLLCPEKYIPRDSGFRIPDATFRSTPYPNDGGDEELMAVFFLDDQEVTVQPDKKNELSVDLDPVAQCPSSDSNLESFYWVTPLAQVNPGSEKVKDACLDPICDPSVVARLQLLEGRLTTAKLATDRERRILIWQFTEPSSNEQMNSGQPEEEGGRAIAAVVGVHFDLDRGQGIKFTTSLLQDDSGPRKSLNRRVAAIFERAQEGTLAIYLKPCDDSSPRIWIKNMPWLSILQLRPLEDRMCDTHFAHLYKLSHNSADVAHRVPCATGDVCLSPGFDRRHGSGVDCPVDRRQARFDPQGSVP